MTHKCVSKLTIIGSDNGLTPHRCKAIIRTNAGILLTGPLGTNFSEILIKIHIFQFKAIHLKMSSAKCRPLCVKTPQEGDPGCFFKLNSLWHSDVIWRHRSGSTLVPMKPIETNVDLSSKVVCSMHPRALSQELLLTYVQKLHFQNYYHYTQGPMSNWHHGP